MLLPDNLRPEFSIYYNGSIVLEELNKTPHIKIMDLYSKLKSKNNMSFSLFILTLDWLFLIQMAEVNDEGVIVKCS